jgi:hypothetical protein
MSINCNGPNCKVRLGRHKPGKVVISPTGDLVYTRAEDAEDVRHVRRLRRLQKSSEPPLVARTDVQHLPADDPRMQLGRFEQRPDGSARWAGR